MPLASTISFGTLTLDGNNGANYIESLDAVRVPGSLKQRFNENVTITEIPGRGKEWLITINGVLAGSSREADLDTLEGYHVGSVRQFTDGDHDGNYIILDLSVNTENLTKTIIRYTLTIRQYTQALP